MARVMRFGIVLLLIPALGRAEDYVPPHNVKDPLKPAAKRLHTDSSLPFIYLEPHDCCFDSTKPISLTIFAVNRSAAVMAIDWRAIVASLSLEALGPGKTKPTAGKPNFDSLQLKPNDFARISFDLRDRFGPSGGSVYRLSYSRPLDDGRFHVADAVQFVIEDFAAVDKLAGQLEAGAGRNALADLLKHNVFFAGGGGLKTYGWDAIQWHELPEMLTARWDEAINNDDKRWREGIGRLTDGGGHPRAMAALLDRLLTMSDQFRGQPNQSLRELLDQRVDNGLSPAERERIHLKLASTRDRATVSRAMNRLMGMKSKASLDVFFRVADGPDSELAVEAISSLSSYSTDAKITEYLRKIMAGANPDLALEAAIVSCYSGDWSGFPLMLRAAKSDNADLRLKAIAQFVDPRFNRYRDKIVPILLAELKSPMSVDHLERAIESLEAYPSKAVLEAIIPFQKHQNDQVRQRAQLVIPAIQRQLNQ